MSPLLQHSWDRCWAGLGATRDGQLLMQRLLDAYGEPQRKYHTGQHLAECLERLDRYLELAKEPAEVEMALWFHDAVYDVRASDNEARSADWAIRELEQAGVASERIARIRDHILATRHSVLPQVGDQALLVDLDLSILAAGPERFAEYERQVREEYGWVPGILYRRKRRQVLAEFLARNPIFSTPAIRDALEATARLNLQRSLKIPRHHSPL